MAESPAEPTADVDALADATVCTVDELNDEISDIVEAADGYFDYVVGDVTDYRDVNGHVHFDLDYDDASIHCIIFGSRRSRTTDELEEGTKVAVAGDLSYYEARGNCSILVSDVVELGDGTYQQEYQEHKRALEKDGLLDDEHKQPLPHLPETIGIVTSADSDAREDAVTSIHERYPDVDVVVHHASVQGDKALPTLLEGISALDRDPDVDLLVVTRGGGADTTLRVFNEPGLCRAIFNTETPIVVGIGHERDRTLADKVADHRVMTPTHVGSVVPEKEALLEEHQTVAESLEGAYERLATRRLEEAESDLDDAFQDYVSTVLTEADNGLDHALESLARERLTELDNRLDHAVEALEREAEYEREKEAATAEVEATYERRQRIQRVLIAILLVLVVGLALYVLFVM